MIAFSFRATNRRKDSSRFSSRERLLCIRLFYGDILSELEITEMSLGLVKFSFLLAQKHDSKTGDFTNTTRLKIFNLFASRKREK